MLTLANGYSCSTADDAEQLRGEPELPAGACAGVEPGHPEDAAGLGIVLNIGYNGAKGGDLDIVRAPNRTATGLLNPNAQAFDV